MLELTYVALLLVALTTAKIGLIDRRAELLVFPTSMVFWAAFALGSFGVQPSFGGGDPVNQPGMFALGLGGFLTMTAFFVLAALDRLPETTAREQIADNTSTTHR